MIPFFNGHLFDVGGLPIHLFGVLVAIGVIVGDRVVVAQGAKRGIDARDARALCRSTACEALLNLMEP